MFFFLNATVNAWELGQKLVLAPSCLSLLLPEFQRQKRLGFKNIGVLSVSLFLLAWQATSCCSFLPFHRPLLRYLNKVFSNSAPWHFLNYMASFRSHCILRMWQAAPTEMAEEPYCLPANNPSTVPWLLQGMLVLSNQVLLARLCWSLW